MVDHVPGQPHVGSVVHFYNPKLLTGVGMGSGHEGRGEGPYAAIVSNEIGAGLSLAVLFPGIIFHARQVPHKDSLNSQSSNGYWDWAKPTDAARAAKELAEHERTKTNALAKDG